MYILYGIVFIMLLLGSINPKPYNINTMHIIDILGTALSLIVTIVRLYFYG